MRSRPAPSPIEETDYGPVRPTTYLIAFKNSEVRVADQYWVSGNTLYYLTASHQRLSVPLSSVDRRVSQRLNAELNVAFILPAETRVVARTRTVVRHTAAVTHKRCYCTTVQKSSASRRSEMPWP
jgi:hypothetical protein